MKIRFITMEQIHNKKNVGSTRIRVHNLIKYWPEAELYKYGELADVLIFQKVYVTQDYKFPALYEHGVKILDICDPDWLDGSLIKETVDGMDGIVTPTKPLAEFIKQLTDKPVKVIKDRFDISEFPYLKKHEGKIKEVVWFGYSHNASTLKGAVLSLEKRNLKLTVISDEDPQVWRWASNPEKYAQSYTFRKYVQKDLYKHLQNADIAVFPEGTRPKDRFKSENKSVIAQLCGVPVVKTADELDALIEAESRNDVIRNVYNKLKVEYDVNKSIKEYQEFIDELQKNK